MLIFLNVQLGSGIGTQMHINDMPFPLKDLIRKSEQSGASVVAFAPSDNIVHANDLFRSMYEISYNDATHASLYWHSINSGKLTNEMIGMPPELYFQMISVARKTNNIMEFFKTYCDSQQIGYHRQIDGWSVQIRIDVLDARFGGRRPTTLAEAIGLIETVSQERRALAALPVGVAFYNSDARLIWANPAAGDALTESPLTLAALAREAISRQAPQWTIGPKGLIAAAEPLSIAEAIVLTAPQIDALTLPSALASIAGLSPTESTIVTMIGAGATVQEAAAAIGWSRGSAQALIGGRIYDKIGHITATSQAGLTRLIWRLAAIARRTPKTS